MGRAYEVRKAARAATGAKKSALNMRASKEVYLAAKQGGPDPDANLALRCAIEKYKGQSIPKEVFERAIKKAAGGDQENYTSGRYEGIGPGGVSIIVDSLTSNVNRAFVEIRNVFNKKGGHIGVPGSVSYNFTESGVLVIKGNDEEAVTDSLILADVDVREVKKADDEHLEIIVEPKALNNARLALNSLGINEFDVMEITMMPNELVDVDAESAEKMNNLLDALDELEDVQNVYHNGNL